MAPGAQAAPQSRHYDVTEHKLSLQELKERLQTNINEADPTASVGLTSDEAKKRLLRDGPNALRPPKSTPEIIKFLKQFLNLFMILLMIASGLSYLAYGLDQSEPVNLYCGIVLCVIIFGQCTVTYLEERKSNNVMASLKKMVPAQCKVVRDGQPRRVPAADLVVGDVVQLKGGDRVPADLRIIQTSGLKVECSSLTGEPDAIEVTVKSTHEEPHESRNLSFNTSQCTEGSAYGVVVRTADKTLIGMVAALASDTQTIVTTLQREVQRVVVFITFMAFVMAIAILIIGASQKVQTVVVINLVITIFVANIPQGLPATVTSCLGIAAKRMFERNVLVKNLEVIETLGSATCICSDKTGTLTQNKMSVQNFWFNGGFEMLQGAVIYGNGGTLMASPALEAATMSALQRSSVSAAADQDDIIDVDGLGDLKETVASRGSLIPAQRSSVGGGADLANKMFLRWRANPLEPILLIAAVCNSAKFAAEEDGEAGKANGGKEAELGKEPAKEPAKQEILGDASESALLRYCDAVYPAEKIRALYPRAYDVPFNSTNKYALCVVDPPADECPGKQYVFLKGAPEVVLERCSKWLVGGQERPMDEDFQRQFQVAYERFAQAGERVLGFARLIVDRRPASELDQSTVPTTGFVFVGLASLMDPPKVGVDQAVLDCHRAGIRVFMVTGDHALTAEAIARKVNIITLPTRLDLAHDRGVHVNEVDPMDPDIQAVVVTGSELRKYNEEKWEWLLPHKEIVFARTTPQQKLEIVEHLQRRGEIVAVTGDGVNDSPALKRADIGVAMGNPNASDVAREAADIIILDDDFCSIVNAIREGRLLFDNLKKSIAYTLTHLVPEIIPILLNIILLWPLGLSSLLILTIDLGSELVPAIALAYEEPESAIMLRKPRNTKTDRLVTGSLVIYSYVVAGILEGGFCMLAYFCVFWSEGIDLKDLLGSTREYWKENSPDFVSRGNTFTAHHQRQIMSWVNAAWYANIILCQMFNIWFCRTRMASVLTHPLFSNKLIWIGMVWELCFILIFCYIRDFAPVFVSGIGLEFQFWLLSLGFLACIFLYTELVKRAARKQLLTGNKSFLAKLAW